jgi:hypothetical protein
MSTPSWGTKHCDPVMATQRIDAFLAQRPNRLGGRRKGMLEVPWVSWLRCFGQELSEKWANFGVG